MFSYWADHCLGLNIWFSFVLASVNFILFVFTNPVKQKRQCIVSIKHCFTKLGNILWWRKKWTWGLDDSQFSFYTFLFLFHYLHLFHYASPFGANLLCLWIHRVKTTADSSLWVFWFPVCSTRQRQMTQRSIQNIQLVQLEEMIVLASILGSLLIYHLY